MGLYAVRWVPRSGWSVPMHSIRHLHQFALDGRDPLLLSNIIQNFGVVPSLGSTLVEQAGTSVYINPGVFIANKFYKTPTTAEVYNPSTGEKLMDYYTADGRTVTTAVLVATMAQAHYCSMPPPKRAQMLLSLANELQEAITMIAYLEVWQGGRPFDVAIADVRASIDTLRYYAGWADKITTKMSASELPGRLAYSRLEPHGVVAAILPYNYPLLTLIWKLAPSLLCGNAFIAKPSNLTPLSALKFAQLCQRAKIPPGLVNIIPGNAIIGRRLVRHKQVSMVSFTGSLAASKIVMRDASERSLKKVLIEAGGKNAAVIFDDCDLDSTLDSIIDGAFVNQGQNCCACSRIYVQKSLFKEFVERLKARMDFIVIGDVTAATGRIAGVHRQHKRNNGRIPRSGIKSLYNDSSFSSVPIDAAIDSTITSPMDNNNVTSDKPLKTIVDSNIPKATTDSNPISIDDNVEETDVLNAEVADDNDTIIEDVESIVEDTLVDEIEHKDIPNITNSIGNNATGVNFGPLITLERANSIRKLINDVGERDGDSVKIHRGGVFANSSMSDEEGAYVRPTLLIYSELSRELASVSHRLEIFGPVVNIAPFDNENQAVEAINTSNFGLATGIFTKDLGKAIRISEQCKSGHVWINTYNETPANMPFGGISNSGIGKELGEQAISQYSTSKTVIVKVPGV